MRALPLPPRLVYTVFCLLSVLLAPLSAQEAAERGSTPTRFEEAMAAFEEGSFAIAQPIFVELAVDARATPLDRLQAQAYDRLTTYQLRLQNRTWDEAEEGILSELSEAVFSAAREIRQDRPKDAFWQSLYENAATYLSRTDDGQTLFDELLEYWASSTDLVRARPEYLRLVRKLGRTYSNTDHALGVLRQAVHIAQSDEDSAYFNLELAHAYARQSMENAPEIRIRQGDALARAVAAGSKTSTYALALWEHGQWSERYGMSEYNDVGQLIFKPDYIDAKLAYEKLLETKREEWSHFRDRAKRAIERLETPDLKVLVSHAFRLEAEVQFAVRWRNIEAPSVEVYRVDPLSHVLHSGKAGEVPPPLDLLVPSSSLSNLQALPAFPHYPVLDRVRLEQSLEPGAYVVVATSGETVAFAPLYVTDLVILSHEVGDEILFYLADADDGEPRPNVDLSLELKAWPDGRGKDPVKVQLSGTTDDEGLWSYTVPDHLRGSVQRVLLASSSFGEGATALVNNSWSGTRDTSERMVYLVTGRSIYRPGDTVRLVGWLREKTDNQWSLPDLSEDFKYEFGSWGGDYITEGSLEMNSSGSFVLDFELPSDAPLGEYGFSVERDALEYWDSDNFALYVEEYRTPDIEAKISFGSSAPIYPGDELEGTLNVNYYAGGAVEDATVEIIVTRTPYQSWSIVPYDGYADLDLRRRDFYPSYESEELERINLTTDARGHATFSYRTLRDADQDYTYAFEARVRDLSRRETVTAASVHVTQQAYFSELTLDRRLLAPGDSGRVKISLQDANEQPVVDDGTLRVTREQWREVYVHRKRGSEISGETYRTLPDRSIINAAQSDYRLLESGFVTEEIVREALVTNAEGFAHYVFSPPETGYYVFEWISRGERGRPVTAEVPLWVSDKAVTELGYRPGGVQLVANNGPFEVGTPIPLMIAAPAQNRWALLTISADALIEHRVIRLDGSSKLITILPSPEFFPNAFVDVSLISNEAHLTDSIELEVPPSEQYLDVLISPDQDGYEPGDMASVDLLVLDADGTPVETELTFFASDEALYSLVDTSRLSVLEAFYGDKNTHDFGSRSSLRNQPFFQPLEQSAESSPFESQDEIIELSPFTVDLSDDVGYRSINSISGTSLNTSLRDLPLSAAAIDNEFLLELDISKMSLRSDFRSTLAWLPRVQTDAEGKATVELEFPDNLTAWRLQALAITGDTRVGETSLRTTTRLPLVARMQTPRFLVEGDVAKLSGIIQNNTESPIDVTAAFEVDEILELEGAEILRKRVPAGGLFRAEWEVEAKTVGQAELSLGAISHNHSDGVERMIEIIPSGMNRTVGLVGRTSEDNVELKLDLPASEERKDTQVTLKLSTTYATQMLGALPYLIEFPYGCTEQTLSRFLPSVAVMGAAEQLALDLEEIDSFIFGELSNEAVGGREDFRDLLEEVIADGITRMEELQLADGSWPWMPGGRSDLFMTAYAVWSLTLAEEMDVDLESIDMGAARDWLERQLIESELSPSRESWVLLALSSRYRGHGVGRPSRMEARSFLNLMSRRGTLKPMNLAMLALSAHYFGFDEDAELIIRNLENTVQESSGNLSGSKDAQGHPLTLPTAFWGRQVGYYHWSEGAVESTAWVLSALLEIDQRSRLIEPAVTWLARNRTGTHWQNTRSTGLAVIAISNYLRQAEDDQKAVVYSATSGDTTIELTSKDWVPAVADLDTASINPEDVISIKRSDSRLGFNFELYAEFYDQSERLNAGSSDISISRSYVHLKPVPTLLQGVSEIMTPLDDKAFVNSGDRIEVVLRIECPRDMSYVLIEDPKPAGFEAVQVLSGPSAIARRVADTVNPAPNLEQISGYLELRDKHVGLLFDRLPEGVWEIRYRLRAESPGRFQAQPAIVEPMYLNHVFGNTDEWRLEVKDAK